jgi:TniQ
MDEFNLDAARLVRMRQDIDALLPDDDPAAREEIRRLLLRRTNDGLDLFPLFRDAVSQWSKPRADAGRAPPVLGEELEIEILPEPRRATFWPYRPRRIPDELLSSWLWRTTHGMAAPPRRFAADAIGIRLADVDRDINDEAIARLAHLSGQLPAYSRRGTMRADIEAPTDDRREQVQRLLLQHGYLVLNRCRGGRGRAVPVVQYCPVRRGGVTTAYLRRGWRFSFEVVCSRDGCLLMDACWKCGALVDPLSSTVPSLEFLCGGSGAPLAKAPSPRMNDAVQEQAMVYDELHRLTIGTAVNFDPAPGPDNPGQAYIEALSSGVPRGTNPANAADRRNAVMLEAARLRETSRSERNEQARAARAATRAAPRQVGASPGAWLT